jgi:hypothetical protein
MIFYRLLKPLWGQKFIERNDEKIKNPDFIQLIKGHNTVEGVFDEEFVQQKNAEGYNVYWFPNHPSKDVYSEDKFYLSSKDIDCFEYVFVDMDLKDGIYKSKEDFLATVTEFPLKPSMVVDSGNGIHVYWKIKDLTRDTYVAVQKRLIQHFRTDDSVFTVLQLMRFPQGFNTKKHGEYRAVQLIEELSGGGPYKVAKIEKHLPELTAKNAQKVQSHLDKIDGKAVVALGEDVNTDELPDKFLNLMYKDEKIYGLFTNPTQHYKDRSGADAALTNILFSKGFNRKDALCVLANTQKALSKGQGRLDYAAGTVDFVYNDRIENKFKTVGEKLKSGRQIIRGSVVNGPEVFDCLVNRWRKGQVMGMIAGSGVGKTTVALKCFKDMIQNNPDNDDVFIFFSLEMPEYEIEERWVNLVGKNSGLANRLYVIGNEDDAGEPRNITLQDIYWFASDIKKNTGKNIGSVVIDHIGLVNPVINLKKNPTFGAEGEIDGGYGMTRTLSLPSLCKALKPLAKMLDTFLIPLTQTTKSKGAGDTPLDKDGAFGSASYEWMMDYIFTMWQPLMRIHKDTDLRVLAWQYAKVRAKHKDDPITTHDPQLLNYDSDTGDLIRLTGEQHAEFERLLPVANEARRAHDKKEVTSYSRGLNVKDLQRLKLAL